MSRYSSDTRGGRLLSLGKRVGRIAESLAEAPFGVRPDFPEEMLSEAIQARRLRHRFFPESLFGEPGWDMLLELLQAEIEGRQATVSNLCEAAGVVGTVALRWVNILEDRGLVRRRPDPGNGIGELVELDPKSSATLRRYFQEVSNAR